MSLEGKNTKWVRIEVASSDMARGVCSEYYDLSKKFGQIAVRIYDRDLKRDGTLRDVADIENLRKVLGDMKNMINIVRALDGLPPLFFDEQEKIPPPVSFSLAVDEFYEVYKKVNTNKDVFVFSGNNSNGRINYSEEIHKVFLKNVQELEDILKVLEQG